MNINYTETTSKDARYLLGVTDSFKSILVEKTVLNGLTTTRSEVLNYLNGKGPSGEPGKQGENFLLTTRDALPTYTVIDGLMDSLFGNSLEFNNSSLAIHTHCKTDKLYALQFKSQ